MRLSLSSTQTEAAREACPRRGATAAARQYLKWDGEVGSCGEPPTHRGGAAAGRGRPTSGAAERGEEELAGARHGGGGQLHLRP